MPSHLDDEKKRAKGYTTYDFAVHNNMVAGHVAEITANQICLPPRVTCKILYYHKLVKSIQLRLFAILCSTTKGVKFDNLPMPKSLDNIDDCIARSRHCIVNHHNRCECINCFSSVSCTRPVFLKHWLQLDCNAVTGPIMKPNKLPKFTSIHFGTQVVHYTHHMYDVEGFAIVIDVGTEVE